MREVPREACEVLGIESAGLTAGQMAECCISELYDADAISDVQSTSSAPCGLRVITQTDHGPKFQDDGDVVTDGAASQEEEEEC